MKHHNIKYWRGGMMWHPFRVKTNADIEKIKESALRQRDKNTYDCARKELQGISDEQRKI